jgi:ankyrin repeat protein
MRNIPLMELLLANNANINIQGGDERMTVLHEAILNEDSDESLITFLLENGADPYTEYIWIPHRISFINFVLFKRNKNNETAIDLVSKLSKPKLSSRFEKFQCKKPSHNDLPIAPPQRRRGRTTSSTNILFLTGFDKTHKESFIKSVQTIFGRKCVTTAKNVEANGAIFFTSISNNLFLLVTHVIACGEVDKIAFRTINYLRGIILGKWIVSEKCNEKDLR